MDECVISLDCIINDLKKYYPQAILLFTPPLIPPGNEWYESDKSLLRNPARSKQYAGCQEHQDGVHFRQKGGSSLAEAVKEFLTKSVK
jgi:hypothetical protein